MKLNDCPRIIIDARKGDDRKASVSFIVYGAHPLQTHSLTQLNSTHNVSGHPQLRRDWDFRSRGAEMSPPHQPDGPLFFSLTPAERILPRNYFFLKKERDSNRIFHSVRLQQEIPLLCRPLSSYK